MKDFQERMDSFEDESRRICDRNRNSCNCKDDYNYDYENDSCNRRPDKCDCKKNPCHCDKNDSCNCTHDYECHCNKCNDDKCDCDKCHDNCQHCDECHNDRCDYDKCHCNRCNCYSCNCQHQIDDCETNCGDWIPDSWGCGCEIPLPPLPPEPDDCCCNRNCGGCGNNRYYDSGLFNLYNHQTTAMAYVPRVFFNSKKDIYNLDTAFERGTLFKELDKPFKGGKCR